MKSTCRFVVLSIVLAFSGVPLRAQTPSILEPKVERKSGPPLWISAEKVADKEKIVDLDLIGSESLSRRVEKQRQAFGGDFHVEKSGADGKPSISVIPPSECKSASYLEDGRGGGGPSSTLLHLAVRSKSIIRGRIRTIDLGFSFGTPASLLGVEVSEVLKGAAPKSPLYVDYPVARFKIGPFYFCNATQGFEPRPGDEVLLFDVTGPVDRDGVLYAPRVDQLFFQDQDGALLLPPQLKNTPELERAQTLTDVVGWLRSRNLLDARGGF